MKGDRRSWSWLRKWRWLTGRYGYLHVIAALAGRQSQAFWRMLGPIATRRYLRAWMRQPGSKLLNLGGGGNLHDDWLTADVDPRADIFLDARRRFPFEDCSLDAIFCEEVIEHFTPAEAQHVLRECYRCLKPGGRIRLSTPDLCWFARRVVSFEEAWFPESSESPSYRSFISDGTPAIVRTTAAVNSIFYEHGHRFIHTYESVAWLLGLCGFKDIQRSEYQSPKSLLGMYDSHAARFRHPPEMSLYVECLKSLT